MAVTNFGLNHPLAVKLYSEKLFREALKETFIGKFIGNSSSSLIQMLTDTQKGAGDKVTWGLRMQLGNPGIQGDSTLEGNEESLSFYNDSITIDQLRNAVRSNGRMSEQRVPYSMREEARMALTDWMSGVMDLGFFNQITGNTGETDVRKTGMVATVAPSTTGANDSISRIIVGGSSAGAITTEASLSATTTHAITLRDLDTAVARAKTMSPVMKPLRIKGEDYFVAFLHPYQVYQLRGQTNTGQWADIQKAALQGGNISGNPLFTGATGVYNGVIIHESTRIPNTTGLADNSGYRRGVLCGQQAAAIAFGQDNGPNRTTWNEKMFDFGNQLGVAAGVIWAIKKAQFNGADYATIALSGYAPQP